MRIGDISVSPGFLLLTAWLNLMDEHGVVGLGLLCCAAHESGHLTVLNLLGNGVKSFNITIFGAEILPKKQLSYRQELAAAFAGPAVNLILAGILCWIPGGEIWAGINFILGIFNLLPFGQMDGGRCLCCLTSILFGPGTGERLIVILSSVVGMTAAAAGILLWRAGGSLTLLFMSLWLLSGISKKGDLYRKRRK